LIKKDFNERYGIINFETSELMDVAEGTKILKSISKDNQKLGLMKKKKSELDSDSIMLASNGRNGRRFAMFYTASLKGVEASYNSLGVLTVMVTHLTTDGSGRLRGDSTKKYWYEELNMGRDAFFKVFKELEKANLARFKRGAGIFINPYYFRYGNIIPKELIKMFELQVKDGDLHQSV